MKKNNTPFSLGYRFLTTIKHRYSLQGFIAFLFLSLCSPLSMEAQAPNISYSGVAANYPLNTAISALTPTNSGGAVVGIYSAVTTFAGTGIPGLADGPAIAASFNYPYSVAVDASGNVYVADAGNRKIRKITAAGVVTTLAGGGTGGDAIGTAASLAPYDVALDASGSMYVADFGNKIRKVSLVGFSINPALPTGLSINASGVISGTPTVVTASKTYTITGVNLGGSSTTTITFGVGATATKDVSEQLNTLTIKPTLAQDVVLIVLSDNKATTVRVFNIAGQQVLTTKAQGEQQMNISTLPSGLYIVKVGLRQAKFVKQ